MTASPLPSPLREQVIRDSASSHPSARREWPLRGIAADLGPGPIDLPTALVVGERDRVEPPDTLEELLLPILPEATRLTVILGAGHLLPLEAPASVAEAVDIVLAGLGFPTADDQFDRRSSAAGGTCPDDEIADSAPGHGPVGDLPRPALTLTSLGHNVLSVAAGPRPRHL